jgi:hypothetical protein
VNRPDRPARLNDVTVCAWWELVSAAADGELDDADQRAALDHAHRCPMCSTIVTMSATPPIPVAAPDPIDTAALTLRERRWLGGRWTRWLLMIAAIVIVTEAVPTYISGEGLTAEAHAARHLASWQIGFGVGLFVAAWMSRMSQAMLAFAATFAALTIVSKAIDVIGGHRGPWADSVHLVELVAVFLLWRLTPAHLLPWTRRPSPPPVPDDRSRPVTPPPLRLISPEPDGTEETR